MRSRAIIVSVIAHGALIAIATRWVVRYAPRAPRPVEAPPVPAPEQPPIAVEVIAWDPPVASTGADRGGRPGPGVSISTRSGGEPPPGPGEGTPARPNPLGMRGRRAQLALSEAAIEELLDNTRPLPPAIEKSGRVAPNGFGEQEIRDLVATVRVYPDGTVDMTGRPHFDVRVKLPIPTRETLRRWGRGLGDWYADPYHDQRADPTGELPRHETATPDACMSFGDSMCGYQERGSRQRDFMRKGSVIGGRADVSGYLQEKLGAGDPYASRKAKLLDDTRAERIELGAVFRSAQLDRAAELMRRNLEALWRSTDDPVLRRERLFELWDECVEGTGATGDAGTRARAMVIGWIRARLPATSRDAFTVEEIAELDARRSSKQHFTPY